MKSVKVNAIHTHGCETSTNPTAQNSRKTTAAGQGESESDSFGTDGSNNESSSSLEINQ